MNKKNVFFFILQLFLVSSQISDRGVSLNYTCVEQIEELAPFDHERRVLALENGLDEWHEKYMKYYSDRRYRILTANSIFTQDALEGGGFLFYIQSNNN